MKSLFRFLARRALARSDAALVKASGGIARTVAGRTLDARFQFIEAQARKRPEPAQMTPAIGRQGTDDLVFMFGGKPEPGVTWSAVTIPAPGRAIPARVYLPAARDPAQPALTYFHFGGGVVGSIESCHAFCTMLAVAMKAPVVSVEYRLAPEHRWPAGLDDALEAYLWTCANAAAYGAPAGRAAVGGDSMGGNFSAIICQDAIRRGAPQPVAQLLVYPATMLADDQPSMTLFADAFPLTRATMDWFMSQYLPPGVDVRDPRLSPACAPDLSGLAPALVVTAGFDPLNDQGRAYAEALRAAGATVKFRCEDSLAHGFTAFTGAIPAADAACRAIAADFAALVKDHR